MCTLYGVCMIGLSRCVLYICTYSVHTPYEQLKDTKPSAEHCWDHITSQLLMFNLKQLSN